MIKIGTKVTGIVKDGSNRTTGAPQLEFEVGKIGYGGKLAVIDRASQVRPKAGDLVVATVMKTAGPVAFIDVTDVLMGVGTELKPLTFRHRVGGRVATLHDKNGTAIASVHAVGTFSPKNGEMTSSKVRAIFMDRHGLTVHVVACGAKSASAAA